MRTVALAAGESFAALLVIVNPWPIIPVFVSLTERMEPERQRREARKIAILVTVVLLVFMVAAEPVLRFFGISHQSLQIAGGAVIALAGFQMICGLAPLTPSARRDARRSIAFTPMTVPLLAGPGAMGAVIALDARDAGWLKYPGFALGIVGVGVVVYVCMRAGGRILGMLGENGTEALTRILGLFVMAIGIDMVFHGIVTHGALTHLH